MNSDPLQHLKALLDASEIIEPSSPYYRTESLTWAAQNDVKPRLVVRPTTLSSLSSILAYLSQTILDRPIPMPHHQPPSHSPVSHTGYPEGLYRHLICSQRDQSAVPAWVHALPFLN